MRGDCPLSEGFKGVIEQMIMNLRIRFNHEEDSTELFRLCPIAPDTAYKDKIGTGKVKNEQGKIIGYYDLFE